MSKSVAKASVSKLPAHLAKFAPPSDVFDEFAGGVTSGFPILSYRGKSWRVRVGGDEETYLNEHGEAVQSVELVLVKSNKLPSKTFYEKKFVEGDSAPPRCWSADGVRPDSEVENPIAKICNGCPNNVWGSKITEQGNKTRACSDVRRVAVVFKHELEAFEAGEKSADEVPVMLLRIPPASLNPLKDYATKVLQPKGVQPFMLVTRIGFDTEVAYPKLTFKGTKFLSETEIELVAEMRDGEIVRRILNEAAEYGAEGPTVDDEGATATPETPEPPKSAAPSAPQKKKKAVELEEMNFDDDDEEEEEEPRAAATEAAVMDDDEEEGFAPPPPAKKAAAKKKPKASKVAAPAEALDDFDALLNSILD